MKNKLPFVLLYLLFAGPSFGNGLSLEYFQSSRENISEKLKKDFVDFEEDHRSFYEEISVLFNYRKRAISFYRYLKESLKTKRSPLSSEDIKMIHEATNGYLVSRKSILKIISRNEWMGGQATDLEFTTKKITGVEKYN